MIPQEDPELYCEECNARISLYDFGEHAGLCWDCHTYHLENGQRVVTGKDNNE